MTIFWYDFYWQSKDWGLTIYISGKTCRCPWNRWALCHEWCLFNRKADGKFDINDVRHGMGGWGGGLEVGVGGGGRGSILNQYFKCLPLPSNSSHGSTLQYLSKLILLYTHPHPVQPSLQPCPITPGFGDNIPAISSSLCCLHGDHHHQEAMALDWARAARVFQLYHQNCDWLDSRG